MKQVELIKKKINRKQYLFVMKNGMTDILSLILNFNLKLRHNQQPV